MTVNVVAFVLLCAGLVCSCMWPRDEDEDESDE
jgi:hypothetical protein